MGYFLREARPGAPIIAGPNGAGKTTAAMTVLPEALHVKEFVNADEIARGLSPLNPAGMAIEAGKIMLKRIKQLSDDNEDFSIETTLASRNYIKFIKECQGKGYIVILIFLYLDSWELARQRVERRVSEGGHDIPREGPLVLHIRLQHPYKIPA